MKQLVPIDFHTGLLKNYLSVDGPQGLASETVDKICTIFTTKYKTEFSSPIKVTFLF